MSSPIAILEGSQFSFKKKHHRSAFYFMFLIVRRGVRRLPHVITTPHTEVCVVVVGGGGSPCSMSIMINGNVALSNLRKPYVDFKKGRVAVSIYGVHSHGGRSSLGFCSALIPRTEHLDLTYIIGEHQHSILSSAQMLGPTRFLFCCLMIPNSSNKPITLVS